MLNFNEKRILEVISDKLLISKVELSGLLGAESNGIDVALDRLMSMGMIDTVSGLGTSVVITQKGIRAIEK